MVFFKGAVNWLEDLVVAEVLIMASIETKLWDVNTCLISQGHVFYSQDEIHIREWATDLPIMEGNSIP